MNLRCRICILGLGSIFQGVKGASDKYMDVSGRGEVTVEEEYGHPYNIQVLVSKNLGKEEMVVKLKDLKALGILHKDFPRTMPHIRKWQSSLSKS